VSALFTFLLVAIIVGLAFLAWHFRTRVNNLQEGHASLEADLKSAKDEVQRVRKRYEPIVKIDDEIARLKDVLEKGKYEQQGFESSAEKKRQALKQEYEREKSTFESQTRTALDRLKRDLEEAESSAERRRTELKSEYEHAHSTYDALKREVSLLEENLEDISFGLYKPHFTFQTSDEYKAKLESLRDQERELIRSSRAATCAGSWTVQGSAREGARMTKQYLKLVLRAFNGECDAALTNVTWNNITKMEARIRKSFDAINDLGSVMQMSITQDFLKLKLDELHLTHEYEEKKHEEKEELRRLRAQEREDEKVAQEIAQAKEEAEEEEVRFEKALAKARAEATAATGAQLTKLTEQIQSLESKVSEAHSKKERAVSRAQLTKSGFVYVISNLGSFGERVVKIGMTRRMEPMERIEELGDASVPFPFDLHAMLYSDDAPALEKALHDLMSDRRVNLVNPRKEFYEGVALDEIEAFVRGRGLSAQFVKTAEAKEYRETLSLREEGEKGNLPVPPSQAAKFPGALFDLDIAVKQTNGKS